MNIIALFRRNKLKAQYSDLLVQHKDYKKFFTISEYLPKKTTCKVSYLQKLANISKAYFSDLQVEYKKLRQKPFWPHYYFIPTKSAKQYWQAQLNVQLKMQYYQQMLENIRATLIGYMEELHLSDRWDDLDKLYYYLPEGPIRDYYQYMSAYFHQAYFKKVGRYKSGLQYSAKGSAERESLILDIKQIQEKLDNSEVTPEDIERAQKAKLRLFSHKYPRRYHAEESFYQAQFYLLRNEDFDRNAGKYRFMWYKDTFRPANFSYHLEFEVDNYAAIRESALVGYLPAVVQYGKWVVSFLNAEFNYRNGGLPDDREYQELKTALFYDDSAIATTCAMVVNYAYVHDIQELKQELHKLEQLQAYKKAEFPDNLQLFYKLLAAQNPEQTEGMLSKALLEEKLPEAKRTISQAKAKVDTDAFEQELLRIVKKTRQKLHADELDSTDSFMPTVTTWRRASMAPLIRRRSTIKNIDAEVARYQGFKDTEVAAKLGLLNGLESNIKHLLTEKQKYYKSRKKAMRRLLKNIELEKSHLFQERGKAILSK